MTNQTTVVTVRLSHGTSNRAHDRKINAEIAKMEKQGWEFVSQEEVGRYTGKYGVRMTFRKV